MSIIKTAMALLPVTMVYINIKMCCLRTQFGPELHQGSHTRTFTAMQGLKQKPKRFRVGMSRRDHCSRWPDEAFYIVLLTVSCLSPNGWASTGRRFNTVNNKSLRRAKRPANGS